MSVQEAYDSILEATVCPDCGYQGMDSDGGFEFVCPNCGYSGSVLQDEEDEGTPEDMEDDGLIRFPKQMCLCISPIIDEGDVVLCAVGKTYQITMMAQGDYTVLDCDDGDLHAITQEEMDECFEYNRAFWG